MIFFPMLSKSHVFFQAVDLLVPSPPAIWSKRGYQRYRAQWRFGTIEGGTGDAWQRCHAGSLTVLCRGAELPKKGEVIPNRASNGWNFCDP